MTPDQLLSKLDKMPLRALDAKERWEILVQIKSAYTASARKHAPSGLEMERRISLLRHWQALVLLYAEDKQLGEPVIEMPPEPISRDTEGEQETWVRVRVLKSQVIRGVQLNIGNVIDLTFDDLQELLLQEAVEIIEEPQKDHVPPVGSLPGESEGDTVEEASEIVAPDSAEPLPDTPPADIPTAPVVETALADTVIDVPTAETISADPVATVEPEPVIEMRADDPVPELTTESVTDSVVPVDAVPDPVAESVALPEEGVANEMLEEPAAEIDGIFAVMDTAEYGPPLPTVAAGPVEDANVEPKAPPEPEFVDLPSFPFLPKKALKIAAEPVVVEPEPEPEPEAVDAPIVVEVVPQSTSAVVGIFEDRFARVEEPARVILSPPPVTPEPVMPPSFIDSLPQSEKAELPEPEPDEPSVPLDEALARLERRPKLPPGYHNKRADELEREAAATTDPAFKRQLLESAEKFRNMARSATRSK
jgi:hypothetical protein